MDDDNGSDNGGDNGKGSDNGKGGDKWTLCSNDRGKSRALLSRLVR